MRIDKVHLGQSVFSHVPACGMHHGKTTIFPEKVTCKKCLKMMRKKNG